MSAMHGQCLLQAPRPCCTIAYTENDWTAILVLFLISFHSQGSKTNPAGLPWVIQDPCPILGCCSIAKFPHRTLCALPSSLVFKFWWRFTCLGLFAFKISSKTVSTLLSEMFLMWKHCQQTPRREHLLAAVRKQVWKCSCRREDGALWAFCCCGCLLLSETSTNSSQEPWLLVLTCNPMLFLRSCFILCVGKGAVNLALPSKIQKFRCHQNLSCPAAFMVCRLPQDAQPECPGKTSAGPKPWFLFGSEKFASIWIVFQAELAIAFGLRGCWFFQHVYKEFYISSKVLCELGVPFLLDLQISCLELMLLYM